MTAKRRWRDAGLPIVQDDYTKEFARLTIDRAPVIIACRCGKSAKIRNKETFTCGSKECNA